MKIDKLNITPTLFNKLVKRANISSNLHSIEDPKDRKEIKDSFQLQKKVNGDELVLEKTELALSKIKRAKEERLEAIKDRLKFGFYLSDEVTEKIANEVIEEQTRHSIDQ
ncbi:MAG: hypothetical protein CR982_03655 [Candidatus Cloacimonadota bacterium]|nr:MAG: hypothetical protein CR982_03655 [Candidatus Cloacimonadota bacterium]PIE78884.1 MAG: hypothetical protein CSA15_05530 [Candidatus Delongbacteria bacterium]